MKLTRRDLLWILPSIPAAGFFAWFLRRVVVIKFLKVPVGPPVWKEGAKVEIAPLSAFPEPWSFRYFTYPLSIGPLRSVVVRVPKPAPGGLDLGDLHFIGLSRICTHMGCTTNYVRNPRLGPVAYGYPATSPFMGCPCHFSAFLPQEGGEAVFGPARYPLPRLHLIAEGGRLFAIGHEVPLRPLED
jgi:arsenite oxidase small subunit